MRPMERLWPLLLISLLLPGCPSSTTSDDDDDSSADDDDDDSVVDDDDDDDSGDDDDDTASDADGDGYPEGTDCDDSDPAVNPGAFEVWNGVDDDCSGTEDDGLVADGLSSWTGENEFDWLGFAVAAAGDLDGDGASEVLLGASRRGEVAPGSVWLAEGGARPGPGTQLTGLPAIEGEAEADMLGLRLAAVGDINGDGADDFALAAPELLQNSGTAGRVYLFFGGDLPADGLSAADADVVLLAEVDNGQLGTALAGGRDLNNDGIDDLAVSAPLKDGLTGEIYIVFGRESWPGQVDLAAAEASYVGETFGTSSGSSLALLPDCNGDGIDDLAIGASFAPDFSNTLGGVYIVFGRETGWTRDVNLGSAGPRLLGDEVGSETGASVAAVPDLNGDGLAELLVGAPRQDGGIGFEAGRAYLVAGRSSWPADASLADEAMAIFDGPRQQSLLGYAVAAGSDLDGDGLPELVVGAPTFGSGPDSSPGRVYVLDGAASASWAARGGVAAAALVSIEGARFGDWFGNSLAPAGDTDGDGHEDFLVGAPFRDRRGTNSGEVYLIHGFDYRN